MPVSESFPVPESVMKHVQNLFLPGEDFNSIFSELDYALNPAAKNSIWTKDTTVTVVPKSKINSIDRYFPKISKEEPFETCSLSQSEKRHGNETSRPADKRINLESKRSADLSSISDDESSDNNEEAIFHSTAIGKLHVNKKFINDYSIDLGNAAEGKTPVEPLLELSDSGSDTSDGENSQNHVGVKSKCNEKHFSSSSSVDSLPEKSKTKEQHGRENSPDKIFFIEDNTSDKSPLYKRVTGSKDLSNLIVEDTKLSSEEDETNNDDDATNKISNSEADEPFSARDVPENDVHQTCGKQSENQSSDEEIIQPSQDPVSPRFDLSSRRKNSMSIKSFLISKDKSKNNDDKDSMDSQDSIMEKTSMSPGWDLSETLSKSRIKKLKTKLVPVTELQCEPEIDPLQIEGLTEENDLFLIQCPTEIDPKFFIDKEIHLSGVSSVTLGNSIKPVRYDYFTIEGPSQKPVDLLLPNQNWTKIQIGRFNLAGNTILSESVDEPEPRTPAISPLKMALLSPIRSLIKQETSSTSEEKKLEDSDMSSEEEVPEVPSSVSFSLSQKNNSSLKSTKQNISTEDSDSSEWQSVYDPESTKGSKKMRRTLSLTEGTDASKFKTSPLSPSKAPPPSESLENLTLAPFEQEGELPNAQLLKSGHSPSKSKRSLRKEESLGTNPEADLISSKLQTPQKESKSDSCYSSSERKRRSRGLKNIFPAAHSQKIKQPSEAITSPSRHKTELSRETEDLSQDAQSFEPFPVSERIHSPFKVQEERSEEKQDVLSPSQGDEDPFSPSKSKRTPKKDNDSSECQSVYSPKSRKEKKKMRYALSLTESTDLSHFKASPLSPSKAPQPSESLENLTLAPSGFALTLPQHPEATLSTHINSSPLKSSRRGEYIIPDNETPVHTSPSINSDSSSYHKNSAGGNFILPGKPVSARKSHPVSFPLELVESSSEIYPVDTAVPEDLAVSDTVFSPKTSSIFTSETTDTNKKKKKKKESKEEYPVYDNEAIAMHEVSILSDELALDEKDCASTSGTKKKKNKRKKLKEYPEDENTNINLPEALTVPDEFAEPETNLIFTSEIATSKKKKKKQISREYPEDDNMDINLPEALTVPDEFAEPETTLTFTSEIATSKKKKKKKISREYPEVGNTDINLPEALTVPDEFAEPETNLIFTSEIATSKKKKKKKVSREYPVDDNVYMALPADLAVPDSDCKSSAITDSCLKKKKKKRKRSLDEHLDNEPQSLDMFPPSEEIIFHKKKKHRPEEEKLNNKFQPTSQYPVIISSANEVSSHKKKTKKKKLKSEEEPVEYEPEFAGIIPSFDEMESSTGGIKYKTEVEFVVQELKPSNLINSDLPTSIKKEKKKKKLQDDASSIAIQNLLQDAYTNFNKKPKKKKKLKGSQADPLTEVDPLQQIIPDDSLLSDKKVEKQNHKKKKSIGMLL